MALLYLTYIAELRMFAELINNLEVCISLIQPKVCHKIHQVYLHSYNEEILVMLLLKYL